MKLQRKQVGSGYFVTYTSTSWNQEVAVTFIQKEGMLIQFDKDYKGHSDVYCCDVSWISKFPDECEILFARSLNWIPWDSNSGDDEFECDVLDDSSGVQTILLKKR